MALINIKERNKLAGIEVLAPERYDPRRELDPGAINTTRLGNVATVVRKVIQPSDDLGPCLVLDTSDAREGIVICHKTPVDGLEIGSAKKLVQFCDVIISRLRPYLHQVAFVDEGVPNAKATLIVCSTEFFVLRSVDKLSIAFLVPFLLSRAVQEVLAAAQEGGHHPRFDDSTLMTLPIPVSLVERRNAISRIIEKSVELYRNSDRGIIDMVVEAEKAFPSCS